MVKTALYRTNQGIPPTTHHCLLAVQRTRPQKNVLANAVHFSPQQPVDAALQWRPRHNCHYCAGTEAAQGMPGWLQSNGRTPRRHAPQTRVFLGVGCSGSKVAQGRLETSPRQPNSSLEAAQEGDDRDEEGAAAGC